MRRGSAMLARIGLATITSCAVLAVAASGFIAPTFAASTGGGGGGSGGGGGGSGGSGGGGGGGSGGGGGGGSTGGSSGSGGDVTNCYEGWVFDRRKGWCVRKDAALDSDLYEAGRVLAVAGEYERALDLLDAVRQKDAMTFTMIGYSKRKMGDVDEGIRYYDKALAIEPDNVLTREYLGEGYVMMGRIDLAEAELQRIGEICGTDCEAYRDLASAIAGDPDW